MRAASPRISECFRREYQRTCELYGLTGEVGAAEETPKDFSAAWDVDHPRRRLAGRDPLSAAALERPRAQRFRAAGLVEDRADVPHHRDRAAQRRLHAHAANRTGASRCRLLADLADHAWVLLGSFVGILCMNLVARARRAGTGRENRRRRHRPRQLRLAALAERTAHRAAAAAATRPPPSTSSSTASARIGASGWTYSPARWPMRCTTARPTKW